MQTTRCSRLGQLAISAVAVFLATAAEAETFLCRDTAGVSIDQFDVSSSADESGDFEKQEWIVDTDRGWRRSDFPNFSGSCQSSKGYVVCKAHDFAFGEATFSIHPDGTNFVLVYLDYGLDALAFAGTCRQLDTMQNES